MGNKPIIDLREKLDVFIITNGRSTFEYCHKALIEQNRILVNIRIIKDKKWIDANNYCVANCHSGFFLRVDDDMILHPNALLFINMEYDRIGRGKKRMAMRFWKLWEPWRRQPVNAIKLYQRRLVKAVGGFKTNKFGKIDAAFTSQVKASKYSISANRSMIGVHACSTAEENIRYAEMRGEQASKDFNRKRKRLVKDIGRYKGTVESQYEMATGSGLEGINKKYKTDFHKFCVEC